MLHFLSGYGILLNYDNYSVNGTGKLEAKMKNILEYFQETVDKYPDKIGFTDKERSLTFSQAACSAQRIGTALAAL